MSHLTLGSLFTGKLVKLTAQQPDDKEALARWTLDAEYLRQLNFVPALPRPPEQFEEKKEDLKNENRYIFMFRTVADNILIGWGGIRPFWSNQSASVWLGIGEP